MLAGVRKFGLAESVRRAVSVLRVKAGNTASEQAARSETEQVDVPARKLEKRTQIAFRATQDSDTLLRMDVRTANTLPEEQSRLSVHVYDGEDLLGSASTGPVQDGYTCVAFSDVTGIAGKSLRYELNTEGEGASILIDPEQERPEYEFEWGKSPICHIYAEERTDDYARWIAANTVPEADLRRQRKASRKGAPVTVISVGKEDASLQRSLERQTYPNWQLLDEEDSASFSEHLTNALHASEAPYFLIAKNTDTLAANALFEMVHAAKDARGSVLVYADDDCLQQNAERTDPFFKPDFSPYYLLSFNYIGHCVLLSRDLLQTVCDAKPTGIYDLVLCATHAASSVIHVKTVLHHLAPAEGRGVDTEQTGADMEALKRALTDRGLSGTPTEGITPGFWQVDYALPTPLPLVSIIIPNHDEAHVLKACLDSILSQTTYPAYEILIAENHSREEATLAYYAQLREDKRICILNWTQPFNFASINNWAAKQAAGQILLFLNNDTTVITPDWLDRMVPLAVRPDVGAVGAKLSYPDDTIQHGGVFIGMHGIAGHAHQGMLRSSNGSFGRLSLLYDVSAVTGACLMMRKDVFEEVGGFDEGFVLAFNDVDLCFRVRQAGYSVLFEPRAELYHYESKTRGYEITPEQQKRFLDEQYLWMKKWARCCHEDPFYNPNLRYDASDFSVAPEKTGASPKRVGQPYDDLLTRRRKEEHKASMQIVKHGLLE